MKNIVCNLEYRRSKIMEIKLTMWHSICQKLGGSKKEYICGSSFFM